MCSILGYFNTALSIEEVEGLNAKLKHRGYDNSTVKKYLFKEKNLFFGHNRLSIQDLSSKANQPMENERFAIVFNGQIYNHLELRKALKFKDFDTHCDTQTLLFAFDEWGIEKTLNTLNGMFAIALFDKLKRRLYLMRDRVGIKPLYYTFQDGELAFASELKGFAKHLKDQVSQKALIQFISLSYIPADNSYYEGIHKLLPAHYLAFDGERITTHRYWSLPDRSDASISFDEACSQTDDLLRSAVRYRLLSDVKVGAFLSGGVDSSLVCAIMQQESTQKIKTFSIGFEDQKYDESPYAQRIANFLGTEHHTYHCRPCDILEMIENFGSIYDEPFGDASSLPMMLLAQKTKAEVDVALSGDGGDELFLGYDRYFFTTEYHQKLSQLPQFLRSFLAFLFKHSRIDRLEKMSYPLKDLSPLNLYTVLNTAIKPWELTKIFDKDFVVQNFGKIPKFLELQELKPLLER